MVIGQHMNTESRVGIIRIASLSVFFLAFSLILPRLLPDKAGFASAASAALIFFALFAVAIVLALWALVSTARNVSGLDSQARIFGVVPTVLLIVTGLWVYSRL